MAKSICILAAIVYVTSLVSPHALAQATPVHAVPSRPCAAPIAPDAPLTAAEKAAYPGDLLLKVEHLEQERSQLHRGSPILLIIVGAGAALVAVDIYLLSAQGITGHGSSEHVDGTPFLVAGAVGTALSLGGLAWLLNINSDARRIDRELNALNGSAQLGVDPSTRSFQFRLRRQF